MLLGSNNKNKQKVIEDLKSNPAIYHYQDRNDSSLVLLKYLRDP